MSKEFDKITEQEIKELNDFDQFYVNRKQCPVVETWLNSKKYEQLSLFDYNNPIFDKNGKFIERLNADVKKETVAETKCYHDWQLYQGLNFDDYYCLSCGETKPLEPSK